MRIVKKLLDPSRPDAMRLRRSEKMSMIHLMYAVTILEDLQTEIAERIRMVRQGEDRLHILTSGADEFLNDLRVTIPEDQRIAMQNIAEDYEIRLAPKASPGETNVIMTRDEFKSLVDFARTKCIDCIDDDEECEKCPLYRLLTSVVPLDEYHSTNLCPYNLGEWRN